MEKERSTCSCDGPFNTVTGEVYALSCDTRLDVDDCAAVTPDGHLHLLLGKLTYHRVRLSGRLSRHILRKPKEKFGECFISLGVTVE